MNQEQDKRQLWGVVRPAWFWLTSLFFGLPLLGLSMAVSGVTLGLLVKAPLSMLGSDPRLDGTLWSMKGYGGEELFAMVFVIGAVMTAALLIARWLDHALSRVKVTETGVEVWSLYGRKTLRWDKMVRAFVTRGAERDGELTLHLWTRWQDLALPMGRVVEARDEAAQREAFGEFLSHVRGHLESAGLSLEEDVPLSVLTDAGWPIRHRLYWAHRRVLSWRAAALRDRREPLDQRRPLPSLQWAWLFRPAPVMTAASMTGVLLWVRWGTVSEFALPALTWGGLAMFGAIPLWNLLKDRLLRAQNQGALSPEMLVGCQEVPDPLPATLLPARGCHVDLERGVVSRPDGRSFSFDAIEVVDYGPPGRYESPARKDRALRQEAWHLALGLSKTPSRMSEIFHNASADIVRHGDVDAGYAVFNWVTARAIALGARADLILAQGRVAGSRVGKTLVELLASDVVRYEPEALAGSLDSARAGVHVQDSGEFFEAWGPLVRQPESCAAPPLWKYVGLALMLGLMFIQFVPGGMLAGWLLASIVHDTITAQHFSRPGFRLDKSGVWVRGQCLPWDELEQSTLMPVAPGPVLFTGRRQVLVVGYLGGTYAERAWLGCAAYSWIQRHISAREEGL